MKYGKAILIAIGVVAMLVSFTSQAGAEIIDETAENIFTLTIDDGVLRGAQNRPLGGA